MENSYIKIVRKIIEWEWYDDSKMVHLFLHLLLCANHTKNTWRGIPLERGQLITGRSSLSKSTGITEQSLRTCLDKLKSTNEITIKPTSNYSIITICKYDTYQTFEKKSTKKSANDQPTINQRSTTNKNDNNNKYYLSIFEDFRISYPGTKRGINVEFENFVKKHEDWEDVLPKLKEAISCQIKNRNIKKSKKEFTPEWKNLKTWISQRCWEEEILEELFIPYYSTRPQN